ncbi:MAG TPA: hypothetical protein VF818_06745 [Ktedonobacterales bacterium]
MYTPKTKGEQKLLDEFSITPTQNPSHTGIGKGRKIRLELVHYLPTDTSEERIVIYDLGSELRENYEGEDDLQALPKFLAELINRLRTTHTE